MPKIKDAFNSVKNSVSRKTTKLNNSGKNVVNNISTSIGETRRKLNNIYEKSTIDLYKDKRNAERYIKFEIDGDFKLTANSGFNEQKTCSVYVTCENGIKLKKEIERIIISSKEKKNDEQEKLKKSVTYVIDKKLKLWNSANGNIKDFNRIVIDMCKTLNDKRPTYYTEYNTMDTKYKNELSIKKPFDKKIDINCLHRFGDGNEIDGKITGINLMTKYIEITYNYKSSTKTKMTNISNLCIGGDDVATDSFRQNCELNSKSNKKLNSGVTEFSTNFVNGIANDVIKNISNKKSTDLSGGSNPAPHKKYKYDGKIKLIDSSENICE
jgi:hypothetical protein